MYTIIDYNIRIGKNLRKARQTKELSLVSLASLVGVSAQQIQKYETGKNRVSASSLMEFSEILCVEVNYFFKDHPAD